VRPLDPRLLRHGRATRGYLVTVVAIGLAVAGCAIAQATLLARVIARVFLGGAGLAAVRPAMLALLGVITLRAALAWGGQVAAHLAADRVKSELRRKLLARALALGPAWLDRERSGELARHRHSRDRRARRLPRALPAGAGAGRAGAGAAAGLRVARRPGLGGHHGGHHPADPGLHDPHRAVRPGGDQAPVAHPVAARRAFPGRAPGAAHPQDLRA